MSIIRTDFQRMIGTMRMVLHCPYCKESELYGYVQDNERHLGLLEIEERHFRENHVLCSGDEVDIVTGLITLE